MHVAYSTFVTLPPPRFESASPPVKSRLVRQSGMPIAPMLVSCLLQGCCCLFSSGVFDGLLGNSDRMARHGLWANVVWACFPSSLPPNKDPISTTP